MSAPLKPSLRLYNDAVDAVQAGQLSDALEAIENSLTEDPRDAQTWQLYAVILNALGESEKANKAMAKVSELGLSEADTLVLKAAEAMGKGKVGVAITHYEDALEIDPERGEIHTAYALALMEGDYAKDAEEASDKAISLLPEDATAWYAHGRVLRLRGKKVTALNALSKSVELDPNLIVAVYEKGMLLAEAEKLQDALQCFNQVLKAHPTDSGAAEARAQIMARLEA